MKNRVAPYLRLKRGGPPACADELQVRDRDTGKIVEDVIEADVSLRFVAVHARDGNGQLRFSDGKAVPERREGNFQIEYKPEPTDVRAAQIVVDFGAQSQWSGTYFNRGEARHRWSDVSLSMDMHAFAQAHKRCVQELKRCVQELEEETQRIREMLDNREESKG